MAETFDPYYRWLGIPAKDQPPNHYRLLGIELFESEADVIEQAADRQMAHLQMFKTGKHSALSQKLLNEVAAAKVCLLRPEKRAGYDRQLSAQLKTVPRERTAAPAQAAPRVLPAVPLTPRAAHAASSVAARSPVGLAPLVDLQALPASSTRPRGVLLKSQPRRRPAWQSPLLLAPATFAAVVGSLLAVVLLRDVPGDDTGAEPIAALEPGELRRSEKQAPTGPTEAVTSASVNSTIPEPPAPKSVASARRPAADLAPRRPARQLPALVEGLGGKLYPQADGTVIVDLKKTRPSRDDLADLCSFDKVTSIDLQDTPVDDAQVAALASCPKLSSLNLSGTHITAASLATLRSLPLKWLYASRTALDDRAAAELWRLEILMLVECPITDIGAQALAKLNIPNLALDGTKITDAGLEALSHSHIHSLKVARTGISGVGLRQLARIAGLRQLDVSGCAIGDAELDAIRAIPDLQHLTMTHVKVANGRLARLNGHPHLRNLWLADCELNDTELAALDNLPELDTISVDRTAVTDQGFAALSRFGKLKYAFANQTSVTSAGAAALVKKCPTMITISPAPN